MIPKTNDRAAMEWNLWLHGFSYAGHHSYEYLPFPSKEIARLRLLGIVAADRESAPCGRWVRVAYKSMKHLGDNVWKVHLNEKLYCRWEQRR